LKPENTKVYLNEYKLLYGNEMPFNKFNEGSCISMFGWWVKEVFFVHIIDIIVNIIISLFFFILMTP